MKSSSTEPEARRLAPVAQIGRVSPGTGTSAIIAAPRSPLKLRLVVTIAFFLAVVAGLVAAVVLPEFPSRTSTEPSVPFYVYPQLGPASPLTAQGLTNASGGCAGPGVGLTEYCYSFEIALQAGTCGLGETCYAVYPNTGDNLSFQLIDAQGSAIRLVNVTLMGPPSGALLAIYSPGSGWSASGGHILPVGLASQGTTIVLNIGSHPGTGDKLLTFIWGGPPEVNPI